MRRLSLIVLIGLIITSLWLGRKQRAQHAVLLSLQESQASPAHVQTPSLAPLGPSLLSERQPTSKTTRLSQHPMPEASWEDLGNQLGQSLNRLRLLCAQLPDELRASSESSILDSLPTLGQHPDTPDALRPDLIAEATLVMQTMFAIVSKFGMTEALSRKDADEAASPQVHPFGIHLIGGVLDYSPSQLAQLQETLETAEEPQQALHARLNPSDQDKLVESLLGKPAQEVTIEKREELIHDLLSGPRGLLQ